MSKPRTKKRWVQTVTTASTAPPKGIFTRDAKTIAKVMAQPSVSPLGIGSAIKMIQYHINRAGKTLDPKQKKELERSKRLLQEIKKKQKNET